MNMYTDRQIALQCATEYSKKIPNMDSYGILRVAERYRKFLEEGIVEEAPKTGPSHASVNSAPAKPTTTGGWRPRIGNG